MRRPFKFCALLAGAGLIVCACSQDPGGNQTTSSSSSATGSGGAHCLNVYVFPSACNDCAHQECCAELAACGAVDYCIECFVRGGWLNELPCSATVNSPAADAFDQCIFEHCEPLCYPDIISGSSSSGSSSGSGGSSSSSSSGSGGSSSSSSSSG
jgi:hypothetical protein